MGQKGFGMKIEIKSQIEMYRKMILRDSDYTQLSDSPLDANKRLEWSEYRQLIRDMTKDQDPQNLSDVVWPTPPESN